MTSARVERVLDEIAHLNEHERQELLSELPGVLHRSPSTVGTPIPDLLAQVQAFRDRVRRRLHAEGTSLGSIEDDLEASREQRLEELDSHRGGAHS
jgi:hypothetical protein